MPDTITTQPPKRRQFSVHIGILRTLIHQQGGYLSKAICELAMNSVDAGATEIRFDIAPDGSFTFSDNGRGFRSLDEIERFFETFGTPHQDGDATYGRFRIGRGQIMSFASTKWRSGHFEMLVDLETTDSEDGYDLITHDRAVSGCSITGRLYPKKFTDMEKKVRDLVGVETGEDDGELEAALRYLTIPLYINGRLVNQLPSAIKWDFEDEYAYYRLDRKDRHMMVYNQGVLVRYMDASHFGSGGVITTKGSLALNSARNEILYPCPDWDAIRQSIRDRFMLKLSRLSKLTFDEAATLLREVINDGIAMTYENRCLIKDLKFIPDIYGAKRSLGEFLDSQVFTLFDGESTAIAERVERERLATVVMPEFLIMAGVKVTDLNADKLILKLRAVLDIDRSWSYVQFLNFVQALSATSELFADGALTPEEQIVLNALRDVNHEAWMLCRRPGVVRKIVAGTSDKMSAWTDGLSFIAIDRDSLKGIRTSRYAGKGPAYLINLLLHEYSHAATSQGDHHHDLDFYVCYHNATMGHGYSDLIDKFMRKYVAGIAKQKIPPSTNHGQHIRWLAKQAPNLLFTKKSLNKLPEESGEVQAKP